ncbi:MAG: type I methionyl aminopeptidase [Bacteroidia bacterium]
MGIIIKSEKQVAGIRESCILAADILDYIEEFVKPGVTTAFLNRKIEDYMEAHSARPATLNYNGYPAASCISLNEVVCHGIPGSQTLKDGDILNIDVTPILNGYFGDTSRMYTVGEISEDAGNLIAAAKECLDIGIRECYPGNYFGNIGYKIKEYAASRNYGVVYEFCGHGVGLKFHEDPEVPFVAEKDSGKKMKPGMIFTVEPMINQGKARTKVDKQDKWTARTIDGKLSAQFEHTILITENGNEVLTDIHEEYNQEKIENAVHGAAQV